MFVAIWTLPAAVLLRRDRAAGVADITRGEGGLKPTAEIAPKNVVRFRAGRSAGESRLLIFDRVRAYDRLAGACAFGEAGIARGEEEAGQVAGLGIFHRRRRRNSHPRSALNFPLVSSSSGVYTIIFMPGCSPTAKLVFSKTKVPP